LETSKVGLLEVLIVRKASLDVNGSHVTIQLSLTIVKTLEKVYEFSLWQAVEALWRLIVFFCALKISNLL
jgi:hypothetical protein